MQLEDEEQKKKVVVVFCMQPCKSKAVKEHKSPGASPRVPPKVQGCLSRSGSRPHGCQKSCDVGLLEHWSSLARFRGHGSIPVGNAQSQMVVMIPMMLIMHRISSCLRLRQEP